MEGQQTVFIASNVLMILSGGLGLLLIIALGMLFFISRKSQHVMQSMLDIMLRPESARVGDATRVLNTIMSEEKANQREKVTIPLDRLKGKIPGGYSVQQQQDYIVKAVDHYHRYLQKQKEQSR